MSPGRFASCSEEDINLLLRHKDRFLPSEYQKNHLFTETEGNSVFCGPETAVVARGEVEGKQRRARRTARASLPVLLLTGQQFIVDRLPSH